MDPPNSRPPKKRRLNNAVPDSDNEEEATANTVAAPAEAWHDEQGRTWIADAQAIADYNSFNDEYNDILEILPNEIPRNHALIKQADERQQKCVINIRNATLALYKTFRSPEEQTIIEAHLKKMHDEDTRAENERLEKVRQKKAAAEKATESENHTTENATATEIGASAETATNTQPPTHTHPTTEKGQEATIQVPTETNGEPSASANQTQRQPQPHFPIKIEYDATGIKYTPEQIELLRTISRESKKAIQAAREKVTIADTIFAVVQRHIRRLDNDLRLASDSLALGLRPDTMPSHEVQAVNAGPRKQTRASLHGLSAADRAVVQQVDYSGIGLDGRRVNGTSATAQRKPQEKFCYCNGPDRDTMVACENEGNGTCLYNGWFHLDCLGYTSENQMPPTWFCRACRPPKQPKQGTNTPVVPADTPLFSENA